MDFGVETSATEASLGAAEFVGEKGHGSTNLKHQRSGLLEDRWRLPKIPRPGEVDFSSKKASESSVAFGRSNLWPSEMDDEQKMLSFTSSEPPFGGGKPGSGSGRSITFSVSQSEHHSRTGGSGSSDGMRGPFGRLKGPFTPSQWMELEHQALIYKHIVANVPVPSNLLLPLRRSLCSYGSYASNFLGWAPFHLGFSGSNDPEPGRCRRTDGKKWRCSRDAVPDQKYCERHINRGRHCSRKPVEGHTGHAASGSATTKVAPVASSSSASVMSMSSSSASDSLCAMQNQLSSLQPNTGSALVNHGARRSQGFQGLSITPPTNGLKSKDVPFSIQKHLPFEELSNPEFGLVSTDSLLNPSERTPYIDNCNSGSFLQFDPKEEANNKHPVHDFIDDWPKDHTHRASGSWPEELRSDWTQLSMSIPVAPDFSSSSSSPAQEKSTLSILRLSHELDPIQMSLGVSNDRGQPIQKQSSWLPVAWGDSMGGPLGEVLTPTTTGAGVGERSSLKAWNSSSQMGSSPSGVLQKSTPVSLSNSSSARSPPGPEQKST